MNARDSEYGHEKTTVFMPRWMLGDANPVGRTKWLNEWRRSRARPETLHVARAMTLKGFDHRTGQQWHPKAMSVIAEDAGVSTSSVKRFLNKGRVCGRLTPTGQVVTLVQGKRSTPLYQLSTPGEKYGRPFRDCAPDSIRDELDALVLVGELNIAASSSQPWAEPSDLPMPF